MERLSYLSMVRLLVTDGSGSHCWVGFQIPCSLHGPSVSQWRRQAQSEASSHLQPGKCDGQQTSKHTLLLESERCYTGEQSSIRGQWGTKLPMVCLHLVPTHPSTIRLCITEPGWPGKPNSSEVRCLRLGFSLCHGLNQLYFLEKSPPCHYYQGQETLSFPPHWTMREKKVIWCNEQPFLKGQ